MSGEPFSAAVLAHYRHPHNNRRLDLPSSAAVATNVSCGDRVRVELRIAGGFIAEAAFQAEACAIAVAAASLITMRLGGASGAAVVPDAIALAEELGPIPPSRANCLEVAVDAATRALTKANAIVVGAVLAAGESRRFGAAKLVQRWRGEPLVRHAARAMAASLPTAIVVGGAHAQATVDAVDDSAVAVVRVSDSTDRGLGDSLAAAARWADSRGASALVVTLGDVPQVDSRDVAELVRRWRCEEVRAGGVRYRGARGHPVLFARETFGELEALRGEQGGAEILTRHANDASWLDVDRSAPPDVDTPGDLERLG